MTVIDTLKKILAMKQPLPFVEFMQHALYSPYGGYYTGDLPKIGKHGDFVTAPELTPLFGQALASECKAVLSALPLGEILEFGAGTGRLCIDILQALEKMDALPVHYKILEISPSLKQHQKQAVLEALPHLYSRVIWLDTLPENFSGVVLANEILDAMPVRRFLKTEQSLLESYVSLDEQGEWIESYQVPFDGELAEALSPVYDELPTPYQSEVNGLAKPWLKALYESMDKGVVLLIDYGFPRHEYFHPDRHMGTLMCHKNQMSQPNPLIDIGLQDITAHVDFTYVAESAHALGFHVAGFVNQASYLLSLEILSLLENIKDEKTYAAAAQALKILLNPNEMGELFKVLALTKNWDEPLLGFRLMDSRGRL